MAVESSSPAVVRSRALEPSPAAPAVDAAFEERWTAWRARGLRHDLSVQRTIRWIALIVAIAAGLIVLALVIAGPSR